MSSGRTLIVTHLKHSLDKGMYYHGLTSGLQSHHLDPEPVQVVLHGLPLVLFEIENVIRKSGEGLVHMVLFPEQRCKLVEVGDMSVGKANDHSNVALDSVLISILQYTASDPPVSIIWVWNAVRWAIGSYTPVKETFGPKVILGNAAFMIARENDRGRALSGTDGTRSSVARSPTCCKSLRNPSLALRSSALSARDVATSAWIARIVSKICCVVTLSPLGGRIPADPAVACLVLLIFLVKTPNVLASGT